MDVAALLARGDDAVMLLNKTNSYDQLLQQIAALEGTLQEQQRSLVAEAEQELQQTKEDSSELAAHVRELAANADGVHANLREHDALAQGVATTLSELAARTAAVRRTKVYLSLVGDADRLSDDVNRLLVAGAATDATTPFVHLVALYGYTLAHTHAGASSHLKRAVGARIAHMLARLKDTLFVSFRAALDALQWPCSRNRTGGGGGGGGGGGDGRLSGDARVVAAFVKQVDALAALQAAAEMFYEYDSDHDGGEDDDGCGRGGGVGHALTTRAAKQSPSSSSLSSSSSSSSSPQRRRRLWFVNLMLRPLVTRFNFHFDTPRDTNRDDKPEWYVVKL
jgi:hypothetical protein